MNSPSVIDYILLHEDLLKSVNSFCVELLNPLSIHCMIHVDIKLQYVKTEVNNNICLKPLPHKFHFDKISEEKFHNYMMSDIGSQKIEYYVQSTFHEDAGGINVASTNLTNILIDAAKAVCKPKCIKKNKRKHKWYNFTCVTALRSTRKLARMLCKDPFNANLRMMYVKSKKLYKNTVKLQKHKYFSNMVSKLNNLCENDPQVYWDTVNNILDKKKKFSNTTISPDDWINHFTQLFQKKLLHKYEQFSNTIIQTVEDRKNKNKFIFNELDFRISTIKIEKAIRKLARGKAGGIDGISNVMLKCSGSSILPALSKLFNLIYNSGFTQIFGDQIYWFPYIRKEMFAILPIIEVLHFQVVYPNFSVA